MLDVCNEGSLLLVLTLELLQQVLLEEEPGQFDDDLVQVLVSQCLGLLVLHILYNDRVHIHQLMMRL